MLSSYPFWWLALPVLLLPIWWHRQKRQRLKAEPLASARFLPSAAPEQLRVWQWRDRILLLVRCLLLVALIAWLAATIFPWRGNTVLLDAGVDKTWAEQQITSTGMSDATRMELPPQALLWVRENERDWRDDARLLIVARAGQIAMPARAPQFGHQVELRAQLGAPSVAAAAPDGAAVTAAKAVEQHVALSTTPANGAAWRALFTAFDRAGDGTRRYVITDAPGPPARRAAQWPGCPAACGPFPGRRTSVVRPVRNPRLSRARGGRATGAGGAVAGRTRT